MIYYAENLDASPRQGLERLENLDNNGALFSSFTTG
jgi:hypothetical protein